MTGKEDTPTWQGPIRTENAAIRSLLVSMRKPFSAGAIRTKPKRDNFRAAACRPVRDLPGVDVLVAGVIRVGTEEATSLRESRSHVWSKFGSSAPKLVQHADVLASDPAGGRASPTEAGRGEEGLSAAPRSSPCLPVALPPSAGTHLLTGASSQLSAQGQGPQVRSSPAPHRPA